ncbi:MAG: asparagine synthase [Nitrosopumilus sp.]|nr:asparagine synthase [Nitrosopumilus sp.]
MPELSWKDFIPDDYGISEKIIEEKIENYLQKNLSDSSSPTSISLSGGVDSSLVLGYIRKLFPNVQIEAVSIKFSESIDETQDAKKIAEHFGAEHHILEVDNYLEILPSAIGITKMPFWDNHWYFISQFASQKSKILASGDGGDEIFGGYTFRYEKFLSQINPNSTPIEKVKAYLNCHERDWVVDQNEVFGNKLNFSWDKIHSILLPFFDNSLNSLGQVFLADYNGKLRYNFSHVNNSINNHFGLKTISPLLSDDLIPLLSHCDYQSKYDESQNIGKIHLRKLLDNFGISHLISKTKLGFSVNTSNLWKNYGKEIFDYYLENGSVIKDGWINQEWVSKYSNKTDLDIRYVNKLLGILALEIWYRIFVTKEMNPNSKLF